MTVTATNLTKTFGSFAALNGVSLEARPGEFLALLGPSGSGKTTLLRIMAGLAFPESGSIAIGGEDMAARPARERGVGFVFQHYALFRHMTVADNIAFGLTVRRKGRPPRAEIERRGDRAVGAGAAAGHGSTLSGAAVGRAAAAGRAGASLGGRTAATAARRTLWRVGPPRSGRICAAGCARSMTGWG